MMNLNRDVEKIMKTQAEVIESRSTKQKKVQNKPIPVVRSKDECLKDFYALGSKVIPRVGDIQEYVALSICKGKIYHSFAQ